MSEFADDMKKHNGSFTRAESSTHCCFFWYTPANPLAFLDTRSVVVFFGSKQDAENFSAPISEPPDLCAVYDLSEKKWNDYFSMAKYDEKGNFSTRNLR